MDFVVSPQNIQGWALHEGVEGKVVAKGEKMTALMCTWAPGSRFAVHTHPHEQIGICVEGEVIFTIDGNEYVVKKGDVYNIPSGIPHAERNDKDAPAVLLDFFAPIREDLLRGRFEQKILDHESQENNS